MKTQVTDTCHSLQRWVAEHALKAIRERFPCPDYRFELELTHHVGKRACRPRDQEVHIVCYTDFVPAPALVSAWRSEGSVE